MNDVIKSPTSTGTFTWVNSPVRALEFFPKQWSLERQISAVQQLITIYKETNQ